MNQLPEALLLSLEGAAGFNRAAFEQVHASGQQVSSIRFNPAKMLSRQPTSAGLPLASRIPWSSYGYYLTERPSFTFDPLLHAGAYYVQEASSMFTEQALQQTTDLSQPLRVLDLCAAPGGKSTLLQSLISKESLLVSNEIIKSRAAILEENMVKWGAANTVITNNDPAHFARLENYFDVMLVDAPCSGSGLFRRDAGAIDEWSENSVALCSQRQQRIIADAWPALKEGGVLIYSTCSYSMAEDEAILDWMAADLAAESRQLRLQQEWNIVETSSPGSGFWGYRFYPDKLMGEGFFIAVVQKKDGGQPGTAKPWKGVVEKPSRAEEAIVLPWLNNEDDLTLLKQNEYIIALPAGFLKEIPVLQSALYIKRAGITAGKIAGKELIPDHYLALSTVINRNHPVCIDVSRQQAIQFLRREEWQLDTAQKGWAIVTYEDSPLGWIKILQNRFNNYYPKEWRILKQPQ